MVLTEKTSLKCKSGGDASDHISTIYCNSAVRLLMPDEEKRASPVWAGLTSSELDAYAADPFWMRVRVFCFFGAVFTFVGLLAAVVVFVAQAPRCRCLQWWQKGPVYRILPHSFMDSDSSGLGDIRGIESKLDYIADLGVKIVWLSPIYKSPMKDFGYDIQDFKGIDETFGDLDDFETLVQAMKQRGLKLVMDFVPNHSSDQHEWFNKSISRQDPYTDYYVWAKPKAYKDGRPIPPNNWVSVFGGSAWEWNEQREEFYLHQFAKEQPDLNFRKTEVVEEMLSVLQFWLDLGVDGFRVDAIPHLFEDADLRDEPSSADPGATPGEYSSLKHVHTHNLPEVMDVVEKFRQTLDHFADATDQVRRLLMVEVYDTVKSTMKYYGDDDTDLADFPFNFLFVTNLNQDSSAADVKYTVDLWLDNMPQNKWANWVLGNHDKPRVATRFGRDLVDGMNMILLLLPGTAVTYYGEEIGMEDTHIPWEQTVDPAGLNAGSDNYLKTTRDPARTPMQWSAKQNAGFSTANSTWLPVNPNYKAVNVEAQEKGASHLNVYKALVRARSEPSVMFGKLDMKVLNGSVFAFTRIQPGSKGYAVAVNFGDTPQTVDLTEFEGVSSSAQVYTKSVGLSAVDSVTSIDTSGVFLRPKEGAVLLFTPDSGRTDSSKS